MKIVYAPLINVQGTLNDATADLDGTVTLYVTVKGRQAEIVLPVREAALLFKHLKKLDVESLAMIHAA